MVKINRISTKLGVIYAALFAAMMVVITVVIYAVVTDRARTIMSDQIVASSEVFSHLFVERGNDLQTDTELQVRDFGFRSAVTSDDIPTVLSALETLRERLDVDGLAIVDTEGIKRAAVGSELPISSLSVQISQNAFDEFEHAPGIAFLHDQAILSGYVGVFAPELIGFVVFGDVVSEKDVQEIIDLSAIPLNVSILPVPAGQAPSGRVEKTGGDIVFRGKIPTLVDDTPVMLVLTYPLSVAFEPFSILITMLVIIAMMGALIVSGASWFVANRFARPVAALAAAADLVRQGGEAKVIVETGDELEELATAFNHMSFEVRSREEELRKRARLDLETGLANRLAFEEALDANEEQGGDVIVLAIRIDRYSEIRGSVGFEAGAHILKEVHNRLNQHEGSAFAALVSGDVLAAIFSCKPGSTILQCTSDLRKILNAPFKIKENGIDISVSIGIGTADSKLERSALTRAMIALDQASSAGTWRAAYDHDRYLQTSQNLSLMGDLLRAIENRQLSVEYQPKFDLRAGSPIGVEALVRWNDPVRGKIFPDAFIPLAEETGHIESLTRYVLSESIVAQHELLHAGHDLVMSVNISGRLVGNSQFSETAMALMKNAAGKLCFEITETAVMASPERGIRALEEFRDAGIDISIDDYGSGLSSLAYLKQLPACELKIDKEFILRIDESNRDAMLTRSTIDLAHSLGMKVTAEGIETESAMALLASMGCDVGQGYYLGRPMALSDLIEFLNEQCAAQRPDASDFHQKYVG